MLDVGVVGVSGVAIVVSVVNGVGVGMLYCRYFCDWLIHSFIAVVDIIDVLLLPLLDATACCYHYCVVMVACCCC